MEYYSRGIKEKGADIVYDAEVINVEFTGNEYIITVHSEEEQYSFSALSVVNCAGLEADKVSEKAGIPGYELYYCKGDYFRLGKGKNKLVKKLVYPVVREDDISLGIHITPDLAGGLRLGPDAKYTGSREKDYHVDRAKRKEFFDDVRKFAPFIEEEDLFVDTSGIRPKLQGPDDNFRDFIISEESEKGFPGFINLIGIESPGLTSSASIAKIVRELVRGAVI
jgi:L-2-hydroxyglutarate oxidase LhgO